MNQKPRRALLRYFLAVGTANASHVAATGIDGLLSANSDSREVSAETPAKPRIARIWRGRVKRGRADEYQAYNYEFGVKPLIEKALGVQAMREDGETESEFVTISYWENVEAMSRFTGGDPTRIHHLPRDAEFLVELPQSVQILNLYLSQGRLQ